MLMLVVVAFVGRRLSNKKSAQITGMLCGSHPNTVWYFSSNSFFSSSFLFFFYAQNPGGSNGAGQRLFRFSSPFLSAFHIIDIHTYFLFIPFYAHVRHKNKFFFFLREFFFIHMYERARRARTKSQFRGERKKKYTQHKIIKVPRKDFFFEEKKQKKKFEKSYRSRARARVKKKARRGRGVPSRLL